MGKKGGSAGIRVLMVVFKVTFLRMEITMNSYRIDEILNGEAKIPAGNRSGGDGQFQKIRLLAAESLKSVGDAILLRELVQEVKKKFEMDTRKAHNYTRNAVFGKMSSYTKEKINGVVFIVKS